MGQKIILILFFVLILGGLIYVFRSGLVGKAEHQIAELAHFPSSSSGGSSFFWSSVASSPYPSSGNASEPSEANTTITTTTLPGTTTTAYTSPYYHQVRFEGISAGPTGQIVLADVSNNTSTMIDVTGWEIKSNIGGEYVPRAINIYDPSGLTSSTDIVMQNGQYVYLYSAHGPFNLRLNECIGYIGTANDFTPPLPLDCPEVNQSAISSFTGACQDFIDDIGTCQTVDMNSPEIPRTDYACQQYIEDNFTYSSCFNNHRADPNFLSNQWWVWMGSSPIDEYHDNVVLYDKNGLVVDTYSY